MHQSYVHLHHGFFTFPSIFCCMDRACGWHYRQKAVILWGCTAFFQFISSWHDCYWKHCFWLTTAQLLWIEVVVDFMNFVTINVGFTLFCFECFCLQCFDTVGWAAGRASCLYKTEWLGAVVVICLERGADLHMAQLMPLQLTVSCFCKIQIRYSFLVPAYPGSPGQRAVKPVCACVLHFSSDLKSSQRLYIAFLLCISRTKKVKRW